MRPQAPNKTHIYDSLKPSLRSHTHHVSRLVVTFGGGFLNNVRVRYARPHSELEPAIALVNWQAKLKK